MTGAARLAALRERYDAEREVRLAEGGYGRYVDLDSDPRFRALTSDPHAGPSFVRDPALKTCDVMVLGCGFAGIMAGAHLTREGIGDFVMIDQAGDFGGTWYWNRYPGVRCDVESYIYLPLIEEVGTVPTEKYARGAEILDHARASARYFGLYDKALLQTRITAMDWSEEEQRWIVATDRGDLVRPRFVILGTGPLNRPRFPDIPGLRDFAGHMFHTSRWDYDYTGGSPTEPMDRLADKRVAVIGTGATGVQVIPEVAAAAKELFVIQRTPAAVAARGNRPTDMAWFRSLKPGWQLERTRNFDGLLSGLVQGDSMVGDEWTNIWSTELLLEAGERIDDFALKDLIERTDFARMEELRARIDTLVDDPATARALKPYHGRYCKRPTFNDEYYPAFNRPNVTLVDTGGRRIDRITATGIEVAGRHVEVDCIIFATGYDAGKSADYSGSFQLRGRGGLLLSDKWGRDFRSLHGMAARGFPNMFVIGTLRQHAVTINVLYNFGNQARHAAAVVADLLRRGVKMAEVTQAAEDGWVRACAEKSVADRDYARNCTPGFYNAEGDRDEVPLLTEGYGGGPFEYPELLGEWRRAGLVARDMELSPKA